MKHAAKNDQQARVGVFHAAGLRDVQFRDNFWGPRIRVNRESTLKREYELLKETGRLTSFNLTTENVHIFWDSDVAKWVEAAAYSLALYPDPALEQQVDEYVNLMESAQAPDGYLNSYYLTKEKDKRWSNLRDNHELYCAGHLIEAAVAYYEHCGKRQMLDIMCRYADHICATFGFESGKRRGWPGHPEIELALMRLFHATGEQRYLDLCAYFVNDRGCEPNFYDQEGAQRKEYYNGNYSYFQAHKPLRQQTDADGHAVRATYLYCGMADLAAESGDQELWQTCLNLWQSIVSRRMYVTGGIGSCEHGEKFSLDYDLPNETAYAETCASIALVFFARRLLNAELDRRYADIMERALYNGVISGVSLDGQKFFYANRLTSYPEFLDANLVPHKFPATRQEWFGCACCPPNIARLFASLGEYTASVRPGEIALHLYFSGEITARMDRATALLKVETNYPWDGKICVQVTPQEGDENFALSLRLPQWCEKPTLRINGRATDLAAITTAGYARVTREWQSGDTVELDLPMQARRIQAHPSVRQDCGKIALQRGPVVYCIEECDNGKDLAAILLPRSAALKEEWLPDLLGGTVALTTTGLRRRRAGWEDALYQPLPQEPSPEAEYEQVALRAVPYALWDNRGKGEMRVWINELNDRASK